MDRLQQQNRDAVPSQCAVGYCTVFGQTTTCVHFTPAFVALDHGTNAKAAEICWDKADGLNRVAQRFGEFHQTCTFCEDREALR